MKEFEEVEEITVEDGETAGEDVVKEKRKHYFDLDEEEEGILESFSTDEEEEEEYAERRPQPQLVLTKALIKAVTRRIEQVKVLMFLYKKNEPCYIAQIRRALHSPDISHSVRKLREAGLIRIAPLASFDKACHYYEITDRKAVKKVIDRYFWKVSFVLARLLSLKNMIRIEDLKKNTEYQIKCNYYGLTPDEGIDALYKNIKKVEKVFSDYRRGDLIGFRRKEQ